MKKLFALVPVAVLAVSQSAHAALSTEVTSAITTAQGDMIALFGALTTAGVAIWVARLIYRKFAVK